MFRKKILALGLVLLGIIFFLPKQAHAYPFDVANDFSVVSSPYGLVTADFNNDGRMDAAVAGNTANRISVLLSDGYGSFASAVNYGVGHSPFGIVAADFDGDGYKDLVVSDGNDKNVAFLKNNGDGTFATAVNYSTGNDPRGMAVGDFNNDGKKDLVVANISDDTVSVLLGNGNGTFGTQTTSTVGTDPVQIVVDDFNNDNKQDLAVANSCAGCFLAYNIGTVSVLTGKGDGTFNAKQDFSTGKGATAIAGGDFNGDGKEDVAVAKRTASQAGILLGNGDGTLQTVVNYGVGGNTMGIVANDFNGDGKADLVLTNSGANTISFLMGAGDGTFGTQTTAGTAANPIGISSADFNQDGKPDLIVSNGGANTARMFLDSSLPVISSISPDSATAGQSGQIITINGSGFEPDSQVSVNGNDQAATFINTTQVQTTISASDLANVGTLGLQVYNPAIDDYSASTTFTIAAAPPIVGGGGLPGAAFSPPAGPEGGFRVIINNGAPATSDKNVSLKFVYQSVNDPKATRFAVSNDSDFTSASVMDLSRFNSDAYSWDICTNLAGSQAQSCSAGKHTVYVKFYSSWGRSSEAVSASINYSPSAAAAAPLPVSATVNTPSAFVFYRTLRLGNSGSDVKKLQEFLNERGFTVSQSGPGSVGHETSYFGRATEAAVKKFQEAYADQILKPLGLMSGTGIFGAATRKFVNTML